DSAHTERIGPAILRDRVKIHCRHERRFCQLTLSLLLDKVDNACLQLAQGGRVGLLTSARPCSALTPFDRPSVLSALDRSGYDRGFSARDRSQPTGKP